MDAADHAVAALVNGELHERVTESSRRKVVDAGQAVLQVHALAQPASQVLRDVRSLRV